jgi:hypothetical protein
MNDAHSGEAGTHGHAAVDRLVEIEMKHLDAATVKFELGLLYKYVRDHRELYIKTNAKGVRTFDLEQLFEFISTSVPVGGEMLAIVEIIDHLLSFATGSCCVERLGRVMNLTKTDLRTLLSDELFFYLVFLKHQMPSLEAVDWEPILKQWYTHGHYDAMSKRRERMFNEKDQQSLVMKRLEEEQARRNHTPIGTGKLQRAEAASATEAEGGRGDAGMAADGGAEQGGDGEDSDNVMVADNEDSSDDDL